MLVYKTHLFLSRPTIGGSDGRFLEGTAEYCSSQEDFFVFPDGACSHTLVHDWLVPLWVRLVVLVTFRRIRELGEEIDVVLTVKC